VQVGFFKESSFEIATHLPEGRQKFTRPAEFFFFGFTSSFFLVTRRTPLRGLKGTPWFSRVLFPMWAPVVEAFLTTCQSSETRHPSPCEETCLAPHLVLAERISFTRLPGRQACQRFLKRLVHIQINLPLLPVIAEFRSVLDLPLPLGICPLLGLLTIYSFVRHPFPHFPYDVIGIQSQKALAIIL